MADGRILIRKFVKLQIMKSEEAQTCNAAWVQMEMVLPLHNLLMPGLRVDFQDG